MTDLSVERTPLVIAAEINMITHQTKKILLASAVEIGRRLTEAKALVKHGEWGKWLEESVNYSPRTASRLMQIWEEYGPDFAEGSDSSNRSLVTDLTYAQAILLLGLSQEEREEFITENDVSGMTKQELAQALKDRELAKQEKDQALHEKEQALQEKNQVLQEKNQVAQQNEVLKKGLQTIDSTVSKLKEEQTKALPLAEKTKSEDAQALDSASDAEGTSDAEIGGELSASVNNPGSKLISEQGVTFTHNLRTEPDPTAPARYVKQCETYCQTIADTFFQLTIALTQLNLIDVNLKEEKRKHAQELMDRLAETIKVWPPTPKLIRIR